MDSGRLPAIEGEGAVNTDAQRSVKVPAFHPLGIYLPRREIAGWSKVRTLKHAHGGRLGGSGGYASDFGSGHDLTVSEFKPGIGLCADSSEPGACFGFCVCLSVCLSLSLSLSLSLCPSPIHALSQK